MKQKLLLKTMLLLFALIAGSTSVWATDVTFTFNSDAGIAELGITKPSSGAGTDLGTSPYTKNGVSLTATNGGTNTRVWNSSGTLDLRIYKNGGSLTFTAPANITQIVLTGSAVGDFTANNGTFSAGTWTGDAASVTLTATGTGKINTITVTYTATSVEMPTFSPIAGAVEKGTEVTISTETDGATIYYTMGADPATPTSGSTLYEGAITINEATTIKAIAIKGGDESLVATAEYTIKKVETPTFLVAEGTVLTGTTVELATTTDGATIHYTTDGTDPTASSPEYISAITIDADMTIKAIAVKTNWDDSNVASATYTVIDPVPGLSIDFESNNVLSYVDWTFTNIATKTHTGASDISAHGGSYWGNTSGKSTASITTKEKVAYPGTFTCYISKESTNTTESYWKIQVSSDNSSWTDVETKSATGMSKGVWQEFTADLTAYINVYVRLSYGSNTAVRAVDDIVLTEVVPVEVTSAGYATYVPSRDLDFSETAIKAYKVKVTAKATATLTQVNKVPAGAPVLLYKEGGATENIPVTTGAAAIPSSENNLCPGTGAAVPTEDGIGNYNMILNNGADGIGFYFANGQTVATNRAYLQFALIYAPDAVSAPMQIVFDDEITGIKAIDLATPHSLGENGQLTIDNYYNLAGQRVAQPTKGLYIVNGRKVVIR